MTALNPASTGVAGLAGLRPAMTLSRTSPNVALRRGRAGPRIRPARPNESQFVCTAVERPDAFRESHPGRARRVEGACSLSYLRGLGSLGRFRGDPAPHEVARVVALVLLEVALVVFLRAPEPGRRDDLGDDRLLEVALRLLLGPESLLLLLGAVREDDRAVLVPVVGALAVQRR